MSSCQHTHTHTHSHAQWLSHFFFLMLFFLVAAAVVAAALSRLLLLLLGFFGLHTHSHTHMCLCKFEPVSRCVSCSFCLSWRVLVVVVVRVTCRYVCLFVVVVDRATCPQHSTNTTAKKKKRKNYVKLYYNFSPPSRAKNLDNI